MPFKRSLAIISTISAVVISGVLAAGAVSAIANDAHKAGEYSPIDPSKSGPNSEQGGADPSSTIDGATGASSAPDIATPSGVASITGPNPSSSASNSGSGAKPIVRGSSASSTGGAGPVNPSPGSGAPATTTTSFDDHGGGNSGGHGSDDPLDDPLDDD
ncbi:MAG: hypothetical protein WCO36_09505 [Actinomycetes bacterium]